MADHFERGRVFDSAVRYLGFAAKNAGRRYAPHAMLTVVSKSLDLLTHLLKSTDRDHQELNLLLMMARALMGTAGQAAPEVGQTYSRARELCERLGATDRLVLVLWGLAGFHMVRAELQTARELGEQLLALAQSQQDPKLQVGGHMSIGLPMFWQGEFRPAQEHLAKGISYCTPQNSDRSALRAIEDHCVILSYSAPALWHIGHVHDALKQSNEAVALARARAHPASLAVTMIFASWLSQLLQQSQLVLEHAEEAIALSKHQGLPYWSAVGSILSGWAQGDLGYGKKAWLKCSMVPELMRPPERNCYARFGWFCAPRYLGTLGSLSKGWES